MATKATAQKRRSKVLFLARVAERNAGDSERAGHWREASEWRLVESFLRGVAEWPALSVQLSLIENR